MTYRVDTARIRSQMGLKELNISQLSEKIGVSRNTVSGVLHGKTPSYDLICKMVDGLGLSPTEAADIFFSENLHSA